MTFFNLVFLPEYNKVKKVEQEIKKVSSRNKKCDNHFDYELYTNRLLMTQI